MRTTLNIEEPILDELRELARRRHRAMGAVASELLAGALKESEGSARSPARFKWCGKEMRARVDLSETGAVYDRMDGSGVGQ
jgi:hypothetical protein